MANNVARSQRPVLKTLHTWIGIVSGLFLSVVALTGSVIVFRGEFERAALPHRSAPALSRQAGLDEAAREIVRVQPGAHVRRVRMPAAPGDPYIFQVQSEGKRTERIVSDSSTGQVLGTVQSGWVDWMVDLHRNLLSGSTGRGIVGAIGIVLFVLSATGLIMWLTGARSWRAWTSVRLGSATRFHYELHRASGLWSYAFLAVISFTGIELAYPQTFRQAVQSLTGKPATVAAPKKIQAEVQLPLDEYLRLGRAAMADGVPTELRLPERGKGPVDLRFYRAGDLSPSGNHVYLNPATGAVIAIDRIVDRPIGARFLAAFSPIHYAQFGGVTAKIAWALFGTAPLLLFVTGLYAWRRPKARPGQKTPKEASSEDFALAGRN
jgi:uncharacterized iron-regulated membrane protein